MIDMLLWSGAGRDARGPRPAHRFATMMIAAALLSALAPTVRAEPLNATQQLTFDIYKQLLEIDTTTATGDTGAAADAMAGRLRTDRKSVV